MAEIKFPYMLSIEAELMRSFMGGYHLGTSTQEALDCVADCWYGRAKSGQPIVTTALKDSKGKLLAVYDGATWTNVSQHVRDRLAADKRGIFVESVKSLAM